MTPEIAGSTGWLLAFLLGAAVGYALSWGLSKTARRPLQERLRWTEERLAQTEAAITENQELRIQLAQQRSQQDADAAKEAWLHTASEQLRLTFHETADQLFRRSATDLTETSRQQLHHLTEPLQRQLSGLDQHVRALEKERQGAYEGLLRELDLLRVSQESLRRSTHSLAETLKAPGSRGRWGEIQLRRLVEMSGLVEWVDFTEQPTLKGGLRPDLVIHLPGGRNLPVDAKTPMNAFLAATEETDPNLKKKYLDEHLKDMRKRVSELAARAYWQTLDGSPDFVIMFLPNESVLAAAYERQADFLDRCMDQKILPATPVTLLAILRSVAWSWRQQAMTEDAAKIAALGRELHDRWSLFDGHLRAVGKAIDQAGQSYNRAVGSVERRLLPTLRRLEETAAVSATGSSQASGPEPVQTVIRRSSTISEPSAPASSAPGSSAAETPTTVPPLPTPNRGSESP